jgi:hypothetical protein
MDKNKQWLPGCWSLAYNSTLEKDVTKTEEITTSQTILCEYRRLAESSEEGWGPHRTIKLTTTKMSPEDHI